MTALKTLNNALLWLFRWLLFILSGWVCLLIMWWAIFRYILHRDFFGGEEIIVFFAFWMYFIGSAVASYEDTHITADIIRTCLRTKRGFLFMDLLRFAISLFAFGILLWMAYNLVHFDVARRARSATFHYPMWWVHISLLISFFLSCCYTVMNAVKAVIRYRTDDYS
ncbi:MAG: TRAP transporter small permease [Planctomycetaceae bacterium]|nr:TRAP transporter small permease [Planctomycetaceae bacterium]